MSGTPPAAFSDSVLPGSSGSVSQCPNQELSYYFAQTYSPDRC